MPTTNTVRISRETQQVLQTLAVIEGETIRGVLERAVTIYQRRAMLEEGNRAYAKLINEQSERLKTMRGLFRIRTAEELGRKPVALDDVEPAATIVKRFSTVAM